MYNWIAKNILARALDYQRGTRTIGCLHDLEISQWWPKDRILALQRERLSRLLRHAYDNVPYYHRIFDERGLKPSDIKSVEDLAKLPLLDKRIIRRNFDLIKARNIPAEDFLPLSTSGSTGEPLLFYSTKVDRYNWGYARTLRARRWAGYDIGDKAAEFGAIQTDITTLKFFTDETKRYFTRVMLSDVRRISDATLPQIARKLVSYNPKFLFGYPSALDLLSRYFQKHGPVNLRLEAVMTNSEQLYDYQRELFRKVFNCETYSRYGSWEVHVVAAECAERNGYHIAVEDVIVEIVDDAGNPLPPGVTGRILLTNLHNYAMPFIRYDIGDTAALSDKACPCGREGLPLMVNLNGRADAVIFTPSGKYIPGRALPGGRFFAGLGIAKFQIVQESVDELVFNIVPDKYNNPAPQDLISREIEVCYRPILGPEVAIKVQFVSQIPPDKSGKMNVIVSKLQK
ncbi:MAG: phenylacetate--CoA ligase family protein [Dehalococcoidales bacterium]|nr:phenylacetate--CoA ligase family protein [Dehalococcoidales bacterium]